MLIEIRKGINLQLEGAPRQEVVPSPAPRLVAVTGAQFGNLRPSLAVETGTRVTAGATLFTDRGNPQVLFTAPLSGTVVALNLGPKRSLLSVVIEPDGGPPARMEPLALQAGRETVIEALLAAGLWPALRTRPFDHVATPGSTPAALYVTAIDTRPHAPDPAVILRPRMQDFTVGLTALAQLAPVTHVCIGVDADLALPEVDGVSWTRFAGPHPAGLVGTHIRYLTPGGAEVWHISYQDVLAIGRSFSTGVVAMDRVIALTGTGVREPRLVQTSIGADFESLLEPVERESRIIAGSLLDGHATTLATAYVGYFHNQISVLAPSSAPSSTAATFRTSLRTWLWPARTESTQHRSRSSGMLAVEALDRVWPHPMPVAPLLRALLVQDTGLARDLGALGLAEEDLALCEYVCPAGLDYGAALRQTLRALALERS
jgi:Na+-transporting NADH:ubiquinone oxidoreductase subunit A